VSNLAAAKRIVIKVGSALLVGEDGADRHWLAAFAADVARRFPSARSPCPRSRPPPPLASRP
jgi:glutamate 5-kinase